MALYRTLAPVNILRLHFLSVSVSQPGVPVGWAKRPDHWLTNVWRQRTWGNRLNSVMLNLEMNGWYMRANIFHITFMVPKAIPGSRFWVIWLSGFGIYWVEEMEVWDCSYELDKGFRESTMLIVKSWSQSIERATPLGTLQYIRWH